MDPGKKVPRSRYFFIPPMAIFRGLVYSNLIGHDPLTETKGRSNCLKTTYTYDHYYKFAEITEILQKYVQDYPDYCRLTSLAKSAEGRDIWKFELTDLSSGDFAEKPGFCVTGNIHAGEVTGSMCAMYLLDYLLTNRKEAKVAEILKANTIYCVPRISPDGSELYLTTPTQIRSLNKMFPYDEPQPGVQPEDIDGDGVIRHMRVKSRHGIWKVSAKDPRVMTRRQPDDLEGDFYNIFNEGMVLDYDGINLKPAPLAFGYDLNRNFPAGWIPEHKQAGSGAYALSTIESRTMAEFVYQQKNLCAVLNFHTMGGMYLFPPGMKPGKECYAEDIDRYRRIGMMATQETTYPCVNIKDDYIGKSHSSVVGAFDDFNHFVAGVMDYTCECWDIDPRSGVPHVFPRPETPSDMLEEDLFIARLKWLDENNGGEGFKNWTPFQHPQLGEVEIGGLDYKGVIQNPPVKFLPQEVEKHTRFVLRWLKAMPKLAFDGVTVTDLGGGNYSVEAVVENIGYLPTYATREAVDLKTARPLTVEAAGSGVEFIRGKAKEEIGHLQGFSGVKFRYGHVGPITTPHEPYAKRLSWVVKAEPGTQFTITVSAPRAGKITETVTL